MACLYSEGKTPLDKLSFAICVIVGSRASKQSLSNGVGMRSSVQVVGYIITSFSSPSYTGWNDKNIES